MIPVTLAIALCLSAQPQPPAGEAPKAESHKYFEVPLKGEVGKEITAPGVRDAIKAAHVKKADCIVFVIDTPGGIVADASAIASIMDQERLDMKYYAVIVRAISAAVWPLSRMDRIYFTPGAAAGAAVAFSLSAKTGAAEVDAKFNAAISAQVSAAAESHGQPGCVYRAMIIPDATLYRWRGPDGKFILGEMAPAGAKDVFELDSNKTVLAWTAQQASESGFGTMMTSSDVASLGKLMNASEWVSVGDGAREMLRSQKEIEREEKLAETAKDNIKAAREKVLSIADRIVSAVQDARKADPKDLKIYVKETGTMTPDSQLRWRQQTDVAIDKWNTVIATLDSLQQSIKKVGTSMDEYNKAEAKAASTRLYKEKWETVKLPPVDHGLDETSIRQEANDTLSRLRTERTKSRI